MKTFSFWCGNGRSFSFGLAGKLSAALILLAILTSSSSAWANGPTGGKTASFEVSAPVRDLDSSAGTSSTGSVRYRVNPLADEPDGGQRGTWERESPPLDRLIGQSQNYAQETSAPDLVFDGTANPFACDGCTPPNVVGTAGPSHFVQMVNKTKVAIFSKKNGKLVVPAFDLGTLWSSGPCATGRGSPVVLFDGLANRWILSQGAGQRHLCFAVSRSANPTGSYFLYTFNVGEFPNDYKIGVWPNGYYVAANETTYTAYAFDRAKMLAGNATAKFAKFTGAPNFLMPANVDGSSGPVSGGLFYTFLDDAFHGGRDRIELYEMLPDFVTPSNSRFRLRGRIRIARFTYTVCGFFNLACIQQRGTNRRLDAVSEWPMHRFAYRRIGGQESLVGNFTVGGGRGAVGAAIRWFELRNSPDGWFLFQQGTHDPGDGLDRFLGSIAMDKDGNIALGYSASSRTEFPSIRYAMQLVGDPAGRLRTERVLRAGSGSQTGSNRWGGSSAMSVDPVVGCQFWYTNQYYGANSRSDWKTAVGAFTADGCSATSGFPDATNTGVPAGLTLKSSGSINSSRNGQIIEGVRVTGSIVVRHDNVIVRQCEVIGSTIMIEANNVTVEYCTVTPNHGWNSGIVVSGTGNTVRRNKISRTENGVFMSGRGHIIEDNYIHDLDMPGHIDGIQLVGGQTRDVIIRHNSIMLHNGANAAVTMGVAQNVTVENNRMHWGGYTVYVDGRSGSGTVENVKVINNRFGPHTFGYISIERASPIISGNVDDATGKPVP